MSVLVPTGCGADWCWPWCWCRLAVVLLQGAVKQKIDFTDREGEAVYIDINGSSMVVGSVNGALKLFDLSRR